MSRQSFLEETAGHIGLLISISTYQIIACWNQTGSINLFSWSRFQMGDANVLFDMRCDCVIECFKLKKFKMNNMLCMTYKIWNTMWLWQCPALGKEKVENALTDLTEPCNFTPNFADATYLIPSLNQCVFLLIFWENTKWQRGKTHVFGV